MTFTLHRNATLNAKHHTAAAQLQGHPVGVRRVQSRSK